MQGALTALPSITNDSMPQQQQQQQQQETQSIMTDHMNKETRRERKPQSTASRLLQTALSDASRDTKRSNRSTKHDRHRGISSREASASPHRRARAASSPYDTDRRSRSSSDRSKSPGRVSNVKFTVNLGPRTSANTFKSTSKKGKTTSSVEDQQREAIKTQALEDATINTNKTRCSFWPQCAKGSECPYHHPSTLCPLFPNCPKPADQCLYIHPATDHGMTNGNTTSTSTIPCKFGSYCTNNKCPFAHSNASNSLAETPCRYYPNCLNPACPYKHGDSASTTTSDIGEMLSAPSTTVTRRVPIQCRDGAECKRPGCHFLHPGDESENVASIPCKFAQNCTRPDCKFFHPFKNKSIRFQDGQPIPESSQHISERSFAINEASEHIPVSNNGMGSARPTTILSDATDMEL
ncbi:hypothetical protein BDF22DRAFT_672284 [Syncephalis plumigaleata]|nr:hypothetical protein BDF22DRAFT_672284 [Syncephalis plumigaleata]